MKLTVRRDPLDRDLYHLYDEEKTATFYIATVNIDALDAELFDEFRRIRDSKDSITIYMIPRRS